MSAKKECKLSTSASSEEANKYSCEVLDAHFYRNWSTSSPDEDLQFNEYVPRIIYDIFGWVESFPD